MKHIRSVLSVLSCVLLLSACGTQPSETAHLHTFSSWQEVPATCTEAGERVRTCLVCHEAQREPIASLGHDMREFAKTDPTCTEAGHIEYRCSRCGAGEEEPLPAVGHSWQAVRELEAATCEGTGLRAAVCSVCGAREEEQIVPALGHDMQKFSEKNSTCTVAGYIEYHCSRCEHTSRDELPLAEHSYSPWQETPATCTTDGKRERSCLVCGKTETVVLPATGHDFDPNFTVDVPPTATAPGKRSRHCRNGCGATTEETDIEPLKQETTYTVTLKTSAGERFPSEEVTISLCTEEGEAAHQKGSSATFTLPTKTYRVEVSGLPEGYALAGEYEVTPSLPTLEVRVPAHMLPPDPPPTRRYRVGSVLYDMKVNVVEEGGERATTLSALVEGYKAVIVNMFFTTCPACVAEMPAFVEAYRTQTADGTLYGEEVACIMLSAEPYIQGQETADRLLNFKHRTNYYLSQYRGVTDIPMTIVHDAWLRAYFDREISGGSYPTSILIDCEGVILQAVTGGMSKSGFLSWMQKGIDRYNTIQAWKEREQAPQTEQTEPAPTRYDLYPDDRRRV